MGWPLGLSGMYGNQPAQTWKDVEDRVTKHLDETPEGELALTYKMLHARGFSLSNVDSRIAAARKACDPNP